MKRSLAILFAAIAIGAALFASSFLLSRRVCESCLGEKTDQLGWLRQEFHLSDADMVRIRTLHEGYLPKCEVMCSRIAAKKKEVESALAGASNVTDTAQQKLTELAELRGQCQAQMIQHFLEVSQAMPPEQGARYLAEMQRQTLGLHEQIEQNMSDSAGDAHGHH